MTISTDRIVLNEERNVVLSTMIQSVNGEFGKIESRPAILILPGGAYSMCSDREAEVIAYPYLQAGYHAFVLRYSVNEHRTWPNPLNDYEQAMELIRGAAEKWNILSNKIAVIGFSAGGHLAACAATLSKNRPNAVILGYAALEQDIAQACQPGTDIPSPTDYVDRKTSPCFLFAARDDMVVPVHNTINFQSALIRHGIQFESHIYAYGGHGFGTAEPSIAGTEICRRVPNWVKDSISWLEDVFGQLTPAGMGNPVCAPIINGDGNEMLSVDCTFGHLRKQEAASPLLAGIYAAIDAIIQDKFNGNPLIIEVVSSFKLCDFMKMMGHDDEAIGQLDAALKQIPNKLR